MFLSEAKRILISWPFRGEDSVELKKWGWLRKCDFFSSGQVGRRDKYKEKKSSGKDSQHNPAP